MDIADYVNPKFDLPPNDLVCQFDDCGGDLFVRAGLRLRPHFAHKPSAPCRTRYASHQESDAHRAGKRCIAEYLQQQFAAQNCDGVRVELEVPIPEAGRVADVLATYPMGWREAHECQLASITPQELAERSRSYFDSGIDVVWWIGEGSAADSAANRRWLQDYQGECVLLGIHQGTAATELAANSDRRDDDRRRDDAHSSMLFCDDLSALRQHASNGADRG